MDAVWWVVLKHQSRLLRQNVGSIVVLFVVPILLAKIVQPTFMAVQNSGTRLAVAGFIVMFAYLFLPTIGALLYKEHEWDTWDRVRIHGPTLRTVMWGKAVVSFVLITAYLAWVLAASRIFEGFSIPATSLPRLAGAVLLVALSVTVTGFALFAACRSVQMFNALGTLVAIVFGGLAGAFAPVEAQPAWLRAAADVIPAYWGRQLIVGAVSEGHVDGLGAVASLVLLAAYCVLMLFVFRLVFRPREPKLSWQ